jgi:hypothetical protein
MTCRYRKFLLPLGFLTLCGVTVPPASGGVVYNVTVDTSSQAGNMGYIDFQFNPSSLLTQAADAVVTNFMTNGALNSTDPGSGTIGDVSGTLPGTVSMDNAQSTNEYTEAITLGSTITFDLVLSGAAIDTPNGQGGGTFTLDFLNSGQTAFLFTNDPLNDVPVLTVNVNTDGSTTAMTFASAGNGPPVAEFSGPISAPEPVSFVLVGLGATVLLAFRRFQAPELVSRRRYTLAAALPANSRRMPADSAAAATLLLTLGPPVTRPQSIRPLVTTTHVVREKLFGSTLINTHSQANFVRRLPQRPAASSFPEPGATADNP